MITSLNVRTYVHEKERQGSRMRQAQLGVLREDPQEDMRLLIENYTGITFKMSLSFHKNDSSRTNEIHNHTFFMFSSSNCLQFHH